MASIALTPACCLGLVIPQPSILEARLEPTLSPLGRGASLLWPREQLSFPFQCYGSPLNSQQARKTTPVGFEPTRGDPIGLAGRRLSRSAKVSLQTTVAAAAVQRDGLLKQVPSYTKFVFHRGSELKRLGLVAVRHQGNVFERHQNSKFPHAWAPSDLAKKT